MWLTSIFESVTVLPLLTALIGVGGFTVGLYSFIDPIAAARIYGVPTSTASPTLTSILSNSPPSSAACRTGGTTLLTGRDFSYIHALGIRNLTTGLGIISLTSYWHLILSSHHALPEARLAVQRALGIVILVGSLVPMVDAWVCWSASRDAAEARTKKRTEDDVKVGASRNEAVETGRKAGNLHAMRSIAWLMGGLWCLLG